MRPHDPLPGWITHVARAEGGGVMTEVKPAEVKAYQAPAIPSSTSSEATTHKIDRGEIAGEIVVEMTNVNVGYHGRQVGYNMHRFLFTLIRSGLEI